MKLVTMFADLDRGKCISLNTYPRLPGVHCRDAVQRDKRSKGQPDGLGHGFCGTPHPLGRSPVQDLGLQPQESKKEIMAAKEDDVDADDEAGMEKVVTHRKQVGLAACDRKEGKAVTCQGRGGGEREREGKHRKKEETIVSQFIPDCPFNSSTACNFACVLFSSALNASMVCFASLSTASVFTMRSTFVFAAE
ncbi:hypothetical protein GW17_00005870 [Ensete ventricosum]|nr:hypothetical protein GW17_00005870 [Ensete ventricosum]